MDLPRLHGIVPPLPTPLHADETIDLRALAHLVDFQLDAGVHGLWILGTTARFDLIPDARQRLIAEMAAEAAAGRVPLVLNVSDQGTERTLTRARMFDDLPYDYYAALPPWYQPMTPAEVTDYFLALADRLARPLVIYNAPWVCNQFSFKHLRQLAEHPRIVGCKDVSPSLSRTLDWPADERRRLGFSYLHGTDLVGLSTELGADGFVTSLAEPFPELAVALWDAARADDAERAFRLQAQFSRLARVTGSARRWPASRPPAATAACSSGCSRPRCGRSTRRPPAGSSRSSRRSAWSPKTSSRAGSLDGGFRGRARRRFVKVPRRDGRACPAVAEARRSGDPGPIRSGMRPESTGRVDLARRAGRSMEHGGSARSPGARRAGLAGIVLALVPLLGGASHRTPNFAVEAPTAEVARPIAEHAEVCRTSIARPGSARKCRPGARPARSGSS